MDCWGSLYSQPRLLGKFPAGKSVSKTKTDCPLFSTGMCSGTNKTHIPYEGSFQTSSISAGYRKGMIMPHGVFSETHSGMLQKSLSPKLTVGPLYPNV